MRFDDYGHRDACIRCGLAADGHDSDHPFEAWKPPTAFDVSDENPVAVANQLRALQREVRDGFDSVGRALTALSRIEERLIVVIDRQNHIERRVEDHERRLAALENPVRRSRAPRK